MSSCEQYVAEDASKESECNTSDNCINTNDNCVALLEEKISNQFSNDTIHYRKAISQFYLNLITKYFLTERTLQAVINSISSVIELSQEHFIATLTDSDLQNDIKERVRSMFQSNNDFFQTFIVL